MSNEHLLERETPDPVSELNPKQRARRVESLTRSGFEKLKRLHEDAMELIWSHPDGMDVKVGAQNVMDVLGTDAATYVQLNTLAAQTIGLIKPDAVVPSQGNLSANEDGTVTVS